MGTLPEVGEQDFDAMLVADARPVLVEFTAEWCGPCQDLAPELERFAEKEKARLRVVAVDVDASPLLTERYGINAMPTLVLFDGPTPAVNFPSADLKAVSSCLDVLSTGGQNRTSQWQPLPPRTARTLHFPGKVPGALIVTARGEGDDRATVSIPAQHHTTLILEAPSLEALDLLGPDDIDELTVAGDGVGDADVAHLLHLTGLTNLTWRSPALTDNGVGQLAALQNLRYLELPEPGDTITDKALALLREAMPNTVINNAWARPDLNHLLPLITPERDQATVTATLTTHSHDPAGTTAYITLVLPPEHHAYAPGAPEGQPITVTLPPDSPWKISHGPVLPDTPDHTLTGTTLIALDLTGPPTKLDLDLKVQLCLYDTCLPPTTIRLSTPPAR